jgi:hypothetical protein
MEPADILEVCGLEVRARFNVFGPEVNHVPWCSSGTCPQLWLAARKWIVGHFRSTQLYLADMGRASPQVP